MRLAFAFLIAAVGLMTPHIVHAQPKAAALPEGVTKVGTVEGLTEYKLANGLKILLIPDSSQPKVTVNCTIFVGSRHEGYGETGMAHLLEHMVFKGCPKFPNVPKALRDHGANFNGTTWLDRTNYFETMPASDENLEFGIELEADRMAHSFIKREDLQSEFTVVRNEFERGENDADRILMQKMLATAYEWHNYGKSTIGNRTDIEKVPIDNLQAFYKKFYRPDNALVIVAGKFDVKKALELIAKKFGVLKNPADPIPSTYTEEPAQDGERHVTLRRVGTVGATGAVYHIPAAAHADFPACEVLQQVLTDEPNGRLYKALVETKKATSVGGYSFTVHDPSVLIFSAQTEPEKTEAARDAMIETLESLASKPITKEEVDRVKRQLLQGRERVLANSQSFAINLSEWAACGDWRLFFLHRDLIEKVTAEDVNKAAEKYLIRSNRTVGVYVPTKKPERADVPSTPEIKALVADYKGRDAVASGEAFDPTPANVEGRVKRGKIGDVDYAFLTKKTRGETVNLTMSLRFGSAESLKGKVAAADFIGEMLMRGSKNKNRQEIKDGFDKLNARVSISSDLGILSINVQTKRANLPETLALLKEVLRDPTFPASEFDLYKREVLESVEKSKTDPQALSGNAFRRKLSPYGKDDVRYTPSIEESIDLLKSVTVDQVKDLYTEQVGGLGQLAVVGDFDTDEALKQVGLIVEGWKSKTPFKRIEKPAQPVTGGTEKILTPDKPNAVYIAGLPLPLMDKDPEYPALVIGNYILGAAPLASRLSNRVRGKDGLSYGVGSQAQVSAMDKGGVFLMFAITNPVNMAKVDTAIAEELTKFLKEGVSASELEEAKKAYLQTLKGQRASDSALARDLSNGLYIGRTFDHFTQLEKKIEALEPADIQKAFDKYVKPKDLIIIQAGDLMKK